MSINSVNISGNLCKDAELKQTQNGLAVLSFSVAVNENRKNAQGNWEQYPNYIDCTMFGTRAQKLAQYLTKGVKVAISGRIHQSRWQTQDGQNRSKLGVNVDDIDFMSSTSNKQTQTQQTPAPAAPAAPAASAYDENIPF